MGMTGQGRLLLILGLLGAVAWWLLQGRTETPVAPPRPRMPNHVVMNFTAIETNAEGQPDRRLVADQLRQYVDEDLTELDHPHLTVFDHAGAPPWEVRSERGFLLAGGEEVHLLGAVRIDREAGPASRPFRLRTEEMRLWPKQEYAQGDLPVRQESDRDWLTAAGVRLWYAKPVRVLYPGRVHLSIAPSTP